MGLEMTFRNLEASDLLRARAEKKFSKVVKHLREPIEGHLVCRVEKHRHRAELTVHSAGETLKVHEETADMYATIDGVMNKLARAARRSRERRIDRTHGAGASAPSLSEESDEDALLSVD